MAAGQLRRTEDPDQIAAFEWLKATTSAERIFVERHMRLDDPLDPTHLAEVLAPIRAEHEELAEQAEHREAIEKAIKQIRYHVDRIAKGRGNAHDGDKIVDAVTALVDRGEPPTSLRLRELLTPIRAKLPAADGRSAAWRRVLDAIDEHADRQAARAREEREPAEREAPEEVQRAAALLRGTEIVLVGGERRVEQEQSIREAFGLSAVHWLTLSDDATEEEFERVIARDEVSVVFQLIRWSRHRFAVAGDLADAHGKPFVRVPGGYNPSSLAHAVLEQASGRLDRRDG